MYHILVTTTRYQTHNTGQKKKLINQLVETEQRSRDNKKNKKIEENE